MEVKGAKKNCPVGKRNYMWVFPKIKVPQNGWFIVVPNPIKMDDLGVFPYFWKRPYAIILTVHGLKTNPVLNTT